MRNPLCESKPRSLVEPESLPFVQDRHVYRAHGCPKQCVARRRALPSKTCVHVLICAAHTPRYELNRLYRMRNIRHSVSTLPSNPSSHVCVTGTTPLPVARPERAHLLQSTSPERWALILAVVALLLRHLASLEYDRILSAALSRGSPFHL